MNVLNNLEFEPYGSSHQEKIGFKLSGIPKGYKIDFAAIDKLLIKRKGSSKYNTTRSENEKLLINSGFDNDITNGEVVWIELKQDNFRTSDYEYGVIRPSHADLSAYQKYQGNWDYSGGGKFSGRMTILYVIAGEIARQVLSNMTSLRIFGHVSAVGKFNDQLDDYRSALAAEDDPFPVVNQKIKVEALEFLEQLKTKGDSIGGKLDIYIDNINRNYGDDFFGGLEAKISYLLFAIPAVKAVEFGLGVEFATKRGSEVVEQLYAENGKVYSSTNYNGGINGGIANTVSPIKLSITIKPTSSIFKEIETVKYVDGRFEDYILKLSGRHDSFIANRGLWPALGLLNILFLDLEMGEKC